MEKVYEWIVANWTNIVMVVEKFYGILKDVLSK